MGGITVGGGGAEPARTTQQAPPGAVSNFPRPLPLPQSPPLPGETPQAAAIVAAGDCCRLGRNGNACARVCGLGTDWATR